MTLLHCNTITLLHYYTITLLHYYTITQGVELGGARRAVDDLKVQMQAMGSEIHRYVSQ
jgi:hypothetical protein